MKTETKCRVSAILNRLFKCRAIVNCERDAYLFRWFVIRFPAFAIFIHKFIRSDEDRALHDHPWPFLVIPIWQGYIEHSSRKIEGKFRPEVVEVRLNEARRVWPIIGTRVRPATYRHRVELIDGKPAWSIFLRFRKVRDWGFWLPTGFVQWQAWWQDKCE